MVWFYPMINCRSSSTYVFYLMMISIITECHVVQNLCHHEKGKSTCKDSLNVHFIIPQWWRVCIAHHSLFTTIKLKFMKTNTGKEGYLEIPELSIVWPLFSERCSKQIIHTALFSNIPMVFSMLLLWILNHAHFGIVTNSISIHVWS